MRGEITSQEPGSGYGLMEFLGPRRRLRNVLVSLLGAETGFSGKGEETQGRHLASREQLLLGCPRVEAAAFCGRGFPEWSRRRASSPAEF